ncbi:hypothetical protein EVAR_45550_1 [Eumeta japonica]|uniref:Uncharacterized protein n=1 Tax=Eumeta variegata TaxID=151549 RepID=A0A4C1X8J8_EUMVA|nr:hypothetical protein EVAR_45550_1 [Eumeta japonica]
MTPAIDRYTVKTTLESWLRRRRRRLQPTTTRSDCPRVDYEILCVIYAMSSLEPRSCLRFNLVFVTPQCKVTSDTFVNFRLGGVTLALLPIDRGFQRPPTSDGPTDVSLAVRIGTLLLTTLSVFT